MQRVNRSTAVAALPSPPAGGTPGYFAQPNPTGGVPATIPGYEWFNAVQEEIIALILSAGLTLSSTNNGQMLEAVQRLIDIQSGNYSLDTGVANAYVVALNPAIAAYSNGMTVRVKIINANTAASTLNAGGGAVPLVNDVGGALSAGDLPGGAIITATYVASDGKFYINSLVQSQNDSRFAKLAGLATQLFSVAPAIAADQAVNLGQFPASLATNGYLKLPNGMIIQWGNFSTGGANVNATWTYPVAFPNAVYAVFACTSWTNSASYTSSTAAPTLTNAVFASSNPNTFCNNFALAIGW